jgi:hypothetical protein
VVCAVTRVVAPFEELHGDLIGGREALEQPGDEFGGGLG